MTTPIGIVPSEIQTTFTLEQKEYLEGFLLAAAKRGGAFFANPIAGIPSPASPAGDIPSSVEAMYFGTPIEDLCKEERIKYEENPLDIWEKILADANANRFPQAGDVFRYKFHGLFHVAPTQDSFMLRLRAPGGVLTSRQMLGLAEMAEDWGAGEAHITTRSNIQIRQFQPKDVVNILTKLQDLGMSSRGAGADNVRNITATPTSGFDPFELLDVTPFAQALNFYILNSRDLYGLPRKFNVAFDGGGAVSVVADTNDIGFVAVRIEDGKSVPEGTYFRVQLCGITGHKQFASDCGLLLRLDQAVPVAVAMLRVFNHNGDRTDRKKARLKYLLDRWGVEKFLHETEKLLAFPLLRFPLEECEPRGPVDQQGHLGIHPQRQTGFFYIGVSVPVGRMSAAQMRGISSIAEEYGAGEIRLTVWQNLILPYIAKENLAAAQQALATIGLSPSAKSFAAGAVACTGNQGCRFSSTDTKSHAVQLAAYLDERFQIEQPINLHVTGCPHSCAQHYIGDIGLLGTKVGGEEGYQVFIGGGTDERQGIGRELISAIRFNDLPPVMEKLFHAYIRERHGEESFLDYTRRQDIEQLKLQIANGEKE